MMEPSITDCSLKQNEKSDFRLTYIFNNVCSGNYPRYDKDLEGFDVVINVSDNVALSFRPYPNQVRLWFPILEMSDWDLGAIFGVMRALERLDDGNKKILIHCAAGANRSPTMITLWKMYRGLPMDKCNIDDLRTNMSPNRYHIPKEITKLFDVMKLHPTWCADACIMQSGFKDRCLSSDLMKRSNRYKRWRWFYIIKWKIMGWKRQFDEWKKK
jgi:hypothetical protein